ncbi:MAG: homoserine dehydrogenase [Lachnospiraceae bacterium]|nr:homoserine dehydrogenase [Lachnospiraceae bacterium]
MENGVINAALLGLGTVGTGVYKVMKRQEPQMQHKLNAVLKIKKILVRNLEKAAKKIDDPSVLTNDWQSIIQDDSIDIVIEVMGGLEPAGTYIMEALRAGKNVVTANKDLIAVRGGELLDEAAKAHVDLLFEASVAGGIPIIRPLKQCLSANDIGEVMGIVNGTTNYILSSMTAEGMSFAQALAEATRLGYAEADPTADIEGYDAGRKVAIMASIAFNSRVAFSDVYTEGITRITANDIRYAAEMGWVIKLLGVAKNTEEGIEARVHPMLIPKDHPLATVAGSYNAVFVHGDAVDDVMFYGRGAGEMPTASAIMGDVFETARNISAGAKGSTHCGCYKNLPIKKIDDIISRYFVRMEVEDKPGVLATVASVLGNNSVSIAQVTQKEKMGDNAEIVVITDRVKECHLKDAILTFKDMSVIRSVPALIRVYG